MVFMILWISESFSLYLLVKNSFNFKLGLFTYFEYISDYHSARWYWCKKDQKNFPQTSHKICSQCLKLWILQCYEHLWFKTFVKIHFQGGKSRKNVISVIKITFSLQKIPQNYRFPCVNTKTIKYTCRFNTSQPWCLIFEIFHFIISYINS